jgi:peptidoglycan/xylan/chitin deacetylase (PgdA/CDA1 family)
LYLTFDDGPHPEATAFVLEALKKYEAKATFFCVGKQVKQHFETYKRILTEGHAVGNHTFDHLDGWKTPDKIYLGNVESAAQVIDSNLFRPPYGRITKFQLNAISGKRLQMKPIMWDVLSGDFDQKVTPDNCYLNVVKHARSGSIIVFHDSAKSLIAIQHALPLVLAHFKEMGYVFKRLNASLL